MSTSTWTEDVHEDKVKIIYDVEDSSNETKYVFSNVVGKISKEFYEESYGEMWLWDYSICI